MFNPLSKDRQLQNLSVSVAICTYNGEWYIAEQLNSMLAQTYPLKEIIICDDCSEDNTPSIIKAYCGEHPIIKVIHNAARLGYNKNFEQALALCCGDVIAFSDQDDVWMPNKIESILPHFSANQVLVHHKTISFKNNWETGSIGQKREIKFSGSDLRKIVAKNTVQGHTIVISRQLKEKCLPFSASVFYDWWVACCATQTGSIVYLEAPLMYHRFHDTSSYYSAKKKGWKKDAAGLCEQVLTLDLPEKDLAFVTSYYRLVCGAKGTAGCFRLAIFLFNNRDICFYDKPPKPFMMVSLLKHALRRAFSP